VKILITVHHFSPHISGVGKVAEQQARRLAKEGEDITVLTSDCSDRPGVSSYDGFKLIRARATNITETRFSAPFPIFSPSIIWRAYKLTKDADIVHVHDAFYISSIVVVVWARILKKPIFLTQHIEIIPHPNKIIMFAQRFAYATWGTFIFKSSNKIFVFNDRVYKFLIKKHIDKNKISFLNNGVDFDLFKPATKIIKTDLRSKYGLPQDKVLALFVGRFVPKKGFYKLVEAVNDNYVLIFVGGEKPNRIMADKRRIFLGLRTSVEISEIYKACDLFVLPSEGEGFPLSIQEAMASGLPIITTDDEGYKMHNFNPALFRMINPTILNIKDNITQLADDSSMREAMGQYSISYAKTNFSWSKNIRFLKLNYKDAAL
jgi:D-inositol-3-phosphate glycosyltransferase